MKKPTRQSLPLIFSSLALAGVFGSWALGCQESQQMGSQQMEGPDTAPGWPPRVSQQGVDHSPRAFFRLNNNWLNGLERWFGDGEPHVSLKTWLNHEAMLVCNIYDALRAEDIPVADPNDFCANSSSFDPRTPPPEPCNWGECPDV